MNQVFPQLILVLGGARSGKSDFAQKLAERSGRSVAFIATASAGDEEMRERIARHRAARPGAWHTIEEPLDLAQAPRRVSRRCAAARLRDALAGELADGAGRAGHRGNDGPGCIL